MRKAVFLDRDGVLSKAFIKNGKSFAPKSLKDFKLNKISTKVTLGGCFVEKINETVLISREKSSKT